MAYVNQEKKAKIAAALKAVVPAGWKYSLAVRNHSTIDMTIRQAPVDLIEAIFHDRKAEDRPSYAQIHESRVADYFKDGDKLAKVFQAIAAALNTDNYDRSDIMTDYFDVGHYVSLNVGKWDSPFLHVLSKSDAQPVDNDLVQALSVPRPQASKSVDRSALGAYLPHDFATLSPGRKAAATKAAMKLAGLA